MNILFILGAALFFSQNNLAAIKKEVLNIEIPKKIVVAIIDTGADTLHDEIKNFIWTNEGETGLDFLGNDKSKNGIDDDSNGFVDDIHGWNFIKNNNDVSDEIGHGTHVTGIIKKEFQRHSQKTKTSRSIRLMILKYYDSQASGNENLKNSNQAIAYANKMGAHVINYSGGGSEPSIQERLMIQESAKNKILFVAAAGNNNANTEIEKYYPANYPIENIISVAATNNQGELVQFSNYGNQIDVAAPGKLILSALPNKKYGFMSGTSQATAYVSGIIAYLLSVEVYGPKEIRSQFKEQGTFNESLRGKTKLQVALVDR